MKNKIYCNKIELWEIPTFVRDSCLINHNGTIKTSVTGKEASRALHIYILWIKNTIPPNYHPTEKKLVEQKSKMIQKHISEILNIINSEDLKIYVS